MNSRFRIRSLSVVVLLFLVLVAPATAGVVPIGDMTPSQSPGVTPGIRGLAFDGTPNPLTLDIRSWLLRRVSLQDASVLATQATSPGPSTYNDNLVHDRTTGHFFTTSTHQNLVRIDPVNFTVSTVGGIGSFFNFLGLAADPSGNLWLATDAGSGQLWTINKATGAGSLHKSLQLPTSGQVTSLMIDDAGQFIVYATSGIAHVPGALYLVDPNTGVGTFLTEGLSGLYLSAMDYDPLTGGYYGIAGSSGSPLSRLVRITDVPEPTSIALALIGALALLFCRRQRTHRGPVPRRQHALGRGSFRLRVLPLSRHSLARSP